MADVLLQKAVAPHAKISTKRSIPPDDEILVLVVILLYYSPGDKL
jgi:hypothetical protein